MSSADPVRDVVRSVLAAHWDEPDTPEEATRAWAQARELGWHLLGLAEQRGGAGGDLEDRLTVAEQLGAFGRRGPHLEVAAAVSHLDGVDGVDVAALQAGEVAALGADDFGAPGGRAYLEAIGSPSQVAVVHDGEVVLGSPTSETVACPAGDELLVVTWDASGPRLGDDELASAIRDDLDLTRCARLVGACRAVARMSTRHALDREQFGRPVIRFQAVGDLVARQRTAADLAHAALVTAHHAPAGLRHEYLDAAVWVCVDAAGTTARLAHQVHGAMGITREHRLQRLTRRLWSWRDQLGAGHARADRLGRLAIEVGEAALWDRLAPERGRPSHERPPGT